MARRPRRNHSPAFMAKVAVSAIEGERTMIELAPHFDVHPNQISVAGRVRRAVVGGCRLAHGARLTV